MDAAPSSQSDIEMKTTPPDHRFPGVSQSQHCWYRFNEWVLCMNKNDGDAGACSEARKLYKSICPEEWVENWTEQIENGNFHGVDPKFEL